MNITKNKNQIERIVNTLMIAYRIKPNALISDNEFVQKVTDQENIKDWVRNSLLNPDEQLAECILPILVDRFESYLKNSGLNYEK